MAQPNVGGVSFAAELAARAQKATAKRKRNEEAEKAAAIPKLVALCLQAVTAPSLP